MDSPGCVRTALYHQIDLQKSENHYQLDRLKTDSYARCVNSVV